MVGQQVLVLLIGVRIPAPQPGNMAVSLKGLLTNSLVEVSRIRMPEGANSSDR